MMVLQSLPTPHFQVFSKHQTPNHTCPLIYMYEVVAGSEQWHAIAQYQNLCPDRSPPQDPHLDRRCHRSSLWQKHFHTPCCHSQPWWTPSLNGRTGIHAGNLRATLPAPLNLRKRETWCSFTRSSCCKVQICCSLLEHMPAILDPKAPSTSSTTTTATTRQQISKDWHIWRLQGYRCKGHPHRISWWVRTSRWIPWCHQWRLTR